MQPQSKRILGALQLAKDEGVLEVDLFGTELTSGAIAAAKFKLNKLLGKGAITVEGGVWKLDKEYWDITPIEFRDIVIVYELRRVRTVVLYSVTIAVIMTLLVGMMIPLLFEIQVSYG